MGKRIEDMTREELLALEGKLAGVFVKYAGQPPRLPWFCDATMWMAEWSANCTDQYKVERLAQVMGMGKLAERLKVSVRTLYRITSEERTVDGWEIQQINDLDGAFGTFMVLAHLRDPQGPVFTLPKDEVERRLEIAPGSWGVLVQELNRIWASPHLWFDDAHPCESVLAPMYMLLTKDY